MVNKNGGMPVFVLKFGTERASSTIRLPRLTTCVNDLQALLTMLVIAMSSRKVVYQSISYAVTHLVAIKTAR